MDGQLLVDFDTENTTKKHIKGNVYLARVSRVEPSLQAVFIEYGPDHNGFLPFSEIHPDYYRIPVDDLRQETEDLEEEAEPQEESVVATAPVLDDFAYPEGVVSGLTAAPVQEKPDKPRRKKRRRYSVQEVIFPKQVLLVQATKDERGTKCAAFTTYLSLAGQYCVLMPNAGERSGGISKRIQEDEARTRLKNVVKDLDVPEKMSVIIRTAGQERTKAEIRRDYDYLTRLWNEIREKTLESKAPLLIHEEADILARVVRDFYQKDIDEIFVDTREAYKKVRDFMKRLSPSSVKKVKLFKEEGNVSLFNAFDIERQIVAMVNPRVPLPSGGSLVIGQTEALVAIDVNSGRATRERNLDTTALKTNLEAAREIARQLRLRDLSGLVVIDFIDMYDHRHNLQVEKEMRQQVAPDRARIQLGAISQFGLMELSRQRLRSSVMEIYSEVCPHCQGRGMTYSRQYFISVVLHALEKAVSEVETTQARLYTPANITSLLLNEHRKSVCDLETKYHCQIVIQTDKSLADVDFIIDDGRGAPALLSLVKAPEETQEETSPKEGRRSRSQHPPEEQKQPAEPEIREEPAEKEVAEAMKEVAAEEEGASSSRRRRRRNRRRHKETNQEAHTVAQESETQDNLSTERPSKEARLIEAPGGAASDEVAPLERKGEGSMRRGRKHGRSQIVVLEPVSKEEGTPQEEPLQNPSGRVETVSVVLEEEASESQRLSQPSVKKRGRKKKKDSAQNAMILPITTALTPVVTEDASLNNAGLRSSEELSAATPGKGPMTEASSEEPSGKKSWIKRIFQSKEDEES